MKTKEEMIEFMNKIDRERGNVNNTKKEEYTKKRIKRVCSYNEITLGVMEYLDSKKIKYHVCEAIKGKRQYFVAFTDIFIPEYNIVMFQENVESEIDSRRAQKFYRAVCRRYYPIFIRSNETLDFVITKLNATILKAQSKPMHGFASIKMIAPPKPKRKRITAVKIEPIKRSINK